MAAESTITAPWVGLVVVLVLVFLLGAIASASRLPQPVKVLIWIGLLLRVLGAFARYKVLYVFYHGSGDAAGYYGKGLVFADFFRRFDFRPITQGGEWYGTEFVRSVSGAVLLFIGPSMLAEYVVFSLLAFLGLIGFAVAFRRSYPYSPITRYLLWIWVFPSLWFWPSSIGKEALVLAGLGLAVMGFAGKGQRINWPVFILGLFLMFGVRPQVVAVFLVAIIIAQWLSFEGRWTSRKLLQGAFLLAVGVLGVSYSMKSVGMEEFDVEGVQQYVEGDKARTTTGGTSVEAVSPGLKGAPVAAINVLFRPFIWEASNPMVLLSCLEIMSLWVIIYARRRYLLRSLRMWRTDRLIRLAIAFVIIYSIALGMMLVNVGIIARQRVFLFPFLFLLIEADPQAQDSGRKPGHFKQRGKRLISTPRRPTP